MSMTGLRVRLALLLLIASVSFAAQAAAPMVDFWPSHLTVYSGDIATIRAHLFGSWGDHHTFRLWTKSDIVTVPEEIDAKQSATFDVMALKAGEATIHAFGFGWARSPITITVLSPEISAVSPPRGPTSGGHDVTIAGMGFSENCMVWFDLVPASQVTLVDRQTIVATTPAHIAGTADVRLFCGAQEIVAERAFEFVGPRRRSVRR